MPHSHLSMRRHILKCMYILTHSHTTLQQLRLDGQISCTKCLYTETWCVQFRFLSLLIPKGYNSTRLESCPTTFCTQATLCCKCQRSHRAGLEPPELQSWLLTHKRLSSSFLITCSHKCDGEADRHQNPCSAYVCLCTQLRSKETTVQWKDRDRSEDPPEHSVHMHGKCDFSVCSSYSSWGSDTTPDNSSLRWTVWDFQALCGREAMAAGVWSSWSHCIPESRCREIWMLSSFFPLCSCLGAVHIHCRSFLLY